MSKDKFGYDIDLQVSTDVAKLLKGVGFWDKYEAPKPKDNVPSWMHVEVDYQLPIPTRDYLNNWLLKTHGLYVETALEIIKGKVRHKCAIVDVNGSKVDSEKIVLASFHDYDSYSEVFDLGLKEALKLFW